MWLFTKYGMYSAVCARTGDGSPWNPVDPNRMTVRARLRSHLERLIERFPSLGAPEILESRNNDYRWRFFVGKSMWAQIVGELVMDCDYDNFKSAAHAAWPTGDQGYVSALHRVWAVHNDVQRQAHGPGIYDWPELPRRKSSFDTTVALSRYEFEDETTVGYEADRDRSELNVSDVTATLADASPKVQVSLPSAASHEPKASDDILAVRDSDKGDGLVCLVMHAHEFPSDADAYDEAVKNGMSAVVHPVFSRVSRRQSKRMKSVPVYDWRLA